MAKTYSKEIKLPSEVEARMENISIVLKGPKGEVKRAVSNKAVKISAQQGKIVLQTKRDTRKEKKVMGTFKAHIKNMIAGVTEGHVYTMKICSGHFPITVVMNKDDLVVKNFFGEKIPRKVRIDKGVKVKISGADITLEGIDKEAVAGSAASIEQLTKRTKYDHRIYQDGIYITSKGHKRIK